MQENLTPDVIVSRVSLFQLLTFFIVYLVIHIIIGLMNKQLEKKLEEEPEDSETKATYKVVNFLFKWFPAIYTVLLMLLLS